MTHKFTERSRKVLELARSEAARLHHAYIGTEHILLGLVKEGSGVATSVLGKLGIGLDKVREAVEALVKAGPPGQAPGEEVLLTPRAKRALDAARTTARELGHPYIGTEHLLMGLLREGEGVAARALAGLGVDLDRLREETLNLLGLTKVEIEMKTAASPAEEEEEGEQAEEEEAAEGAAETEEEEAPRPVPPREIPWPEWVKAAVNAAPIIEAERRLAEVRAAKEAAAERQDFETAAQKRDEERVLRTELPHQASLRALRLLLERPTDPACEVLRAGGLDVEATRARLDALLGNSGGTA